MGEARPSTSPTTVYFGYGSNLWLEQMYRRCPTSKYLGIARLNDFRWIINDRGYANVVQIPNSPQNSPPTESGKAHEDEVWGVVYSLQPTDEANLDVNEGVPSCYTKEYLQVDFWAKEHPGGDPVDRTLRPVSRSMLVYIDRKRTEPATPKHEYVFRMNKGIKDALREGVPERYVRKVLRKFIDAIEDAAVEEYARKQALQFEDEL